MELTDALREETPRLVGLRRHLEMDRAGAGDEHGGLAGTFVEHFAVVGVTRGRVGYLRRVLRGEGQQERQGKQAKEGFHADQSGLMKRLRN